MPDQVEARLCDRRLAVWIIARGLAQKAARENRACDSSECAYWEALNDELDLIDRRLGAIRDSRQRMNGKLPLERMNLDYPWKAKISYSRKDPPPKLPAGCWDLVIPW